MISSLLKNRGLRLQLLVGLLLVLGIFPEPSQGLQCYSCNDKVDPNPDPDYLEVPLCTQPIAAPCQVGIQYCVYANYKFGNNERMEARGCAANSEAQCIKKYFGDCVGADGLKSTEKILNKVDRCTKAAGRAERNGGDHTYYRQCLCDSDLCNKDDCICSASSGDEDEYGDSASILHPFNSVIIAILTVAFYNYT